jgi:predicted Zn-dependent protease
MSVDYFVLRNDYEKAFAAIDALPITIANDPFLDVLRAEILVKARRFDEAKTAAEAASEAEPSLIDAYWIQVRISLEQDQFGETLKLLKTIDQTGAVTWDATLPTPPYSEFRGSPEYRDWLDYLEQKKSQ